MSVFHYHIIKFKNIVKSGHVSAARAILKGKNNHQSEWHFLSQCSFAQHSWFKIFLEGGATLREAEWRYILEFIRNIELIELLSFLVVNGGEFLFSLPTHWNATPGYRLKINVFFYNNLTLRECLYASMTQVRLAHLQFYVLGMHLIWKCFYDFFNEETWRTRVKKKINILFMQHAACCIKK